MKKVLLLSMGLLICLLLPLLGSGGDSAVTAQEPTATPNLPQYQTGNFPRAMVWDGGDFVWVANWYDNTVTNIQVSTGNVIGDPILDPALADETALAPGRGPVALEHDGQFLWIANQFRSIVSVIDRTGQVQTSYTAIQHGIDAPVDFYFDGTNMWVLNQGGAQTNGSVVRIRGGNVSVPYQVGRFPTSITYDGTRIWVANGLDNTLTAIDAETGEFVTEVEVGVFPTSVVFTGRHLWVGHYDGSIQVLSVTIGFDAEGNEVLNVSEPVFNVAAPPGDPPRPIDLLYAFEHVWVTNVHQESGSVTAYRAEDGRTANAFSVPVDGAFPATLTNTGNQIWVADWVTRDVTTFNAGVVWEVAPLNVAAVITSTPEVWLPTAVPTNTPTPTATPEACDPTLPPRLTVGGTGEVSDDSFPGLQLRLRTGPSLFESQVIRTYPVGTEFEVLSGFVCEDNLAFWEVSILDDGEVGWFSENFDGQYTIEPVE
jgi:YVTN family beta-propeller protein